MTVTREEDISLLPQFLENCKRQYVSICLSPLNMFQKMSVHVEGSTYVRGVSDVLGNAILVVINSSHFGTNFPTVKCS